MSSASAEPRERVPLPGVRAPKPLLDPAVERQLTPRQRELLDALEELVVRGELSELTMAEIAATTSCSLRTLYAIAQSKEELFLAVVDRRLHRIGRRAIASLDPTLSPIEALRTYVNVAGEALDPERRAFSREFADLPGGREMLAAHERYVVSVVQSLLERAVSEGQIAPCDTRSIAYLLGRLGRELVRLEDAGARPAPRAAVAEIVDIVLHGLVARSRRRASSRGRSRARAD